MRKQERRNTMNLKDLNNLGVKSGDALIIQDRYYQCVIGVIDGRYINGYRILNSTKSEKYSLHRVYVPLTSLVASESEDVVVKTISKSEFAKYKRKAEAVLTMRDFKDLIDTSLYAD